MGGNGISYSGAIMVVLEMYPLEKYRGRKLWGIIFECSTTCLCAYMHSNLNKSTNIAEHIGLSGRRTSAANIRWKRKLSKNTKWQ